MPLTMIKLGETRCIQKITCKEETRRRLEALGFIAGETVTAITELSGNLILNVKGARVALNKALASSILVS